MLMVSRFREMKGIEKLGRGGGVTACWIRNKRHEFRLVHVWDVRIGHLFEGKSASPLGFQLNLVGSIQVLGNVCPHKGLNTRWGTAPCHAEDQVPLCLMYSTPCQLMNQQFTKFR